MKILKRHIIIVLSVCLIATTAIANNTKKSDTKKGNFQKQTFVNKKGTDTENLKGVPNPGGGGGGGGPIPINGGLSILIIGSIAFWGRKIQEELKDE